MSRTSSRLSHFVVPLILCVVNCFAANNCDFDSDVELGDRLGIDDEVVVKNGILYAAKDVQNTEGLKRGCFCDINVCVRKCCPMGQYMLNRTCVLSGKPFVIPNEMRPGLSGYQLVFGNECKHDKRRSLLDPVFEEDYFTITTTGRLRTPFDGAVYKLRDYCVDYIEQFDRIQALVCAYRNANISSSNVVGMIISMPFLLLTFVIYALLPERNLHRKCLMCYVLTLFCAYLCLAIAQIHPNDIEFDTCEALGILCYFFFMVSFLFMNAMSFDMWWTFSGMRGFSGTKKEKERKRFIAYSLYSWGVPVVLVIIVTSLTHSTIPLDAWYNPGIGDGQCWFRLRGQYAELLFFHGPLAILIMVNIILFCLTAFKIREAQKATVMLSTSDSRRHSMEKDKERYYLFLKLMLAMGLNWSTELISTVVRWQVKDVPEDVWYITDLCNGLYGMFIFFVFVFKRSTWELLKQRYYTATGKPNLQRSINDPLASVHSNKLQQDDSNLYKNGNQLELK
ncbi:hypothetical protein PPYR_14044 [Photinus pyralis]|uniref:G-protein coupled receptors family 2 profile 2 domain-containing protein n=2 Tax=Photinus pyralis TaxID=7054 RepID=A0A5N4A439_PHOPY|nr:G-protein coupled receptor Mth2-like [Photinus pyralis]KAB0792083.1 hypothetical protein PPYR_14044 [Photinus pyralis]